MSDLPEDRKNNQKYVIEWQAEGGRRILTFYCALAEVPSVCSACKIDASIKGDEKVISKTIL